MAIRRNPQQEYEKLKHAAVLARQPFEREAWLNLAFYLDEQYVEWHEGTNALRRIPRDKSAQNAPRPVVNKIMHFVQQEKAMVLQAKPDPDVLPATDDMVDSSNTAVAKAYCSYVSEPTIANWNKQLGRATLWAIICGDGYLKWTWNAAEKQVEIIPASIFEIWTDPYAQDFGKCRYVGHTKFMDVAAASDAFNMEIEPTSQESADPMRSQLLQGMGSAPVTSGVTVNELWHKPCRKYPEGLFTVWTGRQTLVPPQPLPYKHGRLPFTQVGCIERPDSQHYMSPVKYLRSAQMELNKYHAQRIMIREAFANPKWWIPAELELEQMPNDSPRQILTGQSGNGMIRPEIIQPTTYPGNDDGEMIESQMMHIVGLHEVSQAQVPGRVEAAKAIELLKESDADRQATMLDSINTTISEGFYQVLMLAKQFETEGQMLHIYSREGMPEVKRFRAEAIQPAMRVRTTTGTGLARSRAARQDQLMNMWDRKIIQDPDLMAELMEVPSPSFSQPRAHDIKLARNENTTICKDVPVTANSWDDHSVHLREHNNYRKTQEFLTSDPKVKEKFEFHCQMHEKLMIDGAVKQAKLAAAMQPMAPPPPAGADPAAGQPTETATPAQ